MWSTTSHAANALCSPPPARCKDCYPPTTRLPGTPCLCTSPPTCASRIQLAIKGPDSSRAMDRALGMFSTSCCDQPALASALARLLPCRFSAAGSGGAAAAAALGARASRGSGWVRCSGAQALLEEGWGRAALAHW